MASKLMTIYNIINIYTDPKLAITISKGAPCPGRLTTSLLQINYQYQGNKQLFNWRINTSLPRQFGIPTIAN